MPQGDALLMILLRYPQELVDAGDYALPDKAMSSYRITPRELAMAGDLIESMSGEWKPGDYRDEFRDKLRKVIEKRLKTKGVTTTVEEDDDNVAEDATTNVVDFMALLKKSIASKHRTPAKKTAGKKTASKKSATKKAAAKKSTHKTPAKKAATRSKSRKAG
jgi:DNA end-binding protein Ku